MVRNTKAVRQAIKKQILSGPVAPPCKKGHQHIWPTTGPITKEDIGSCQVICQFCSMDEKKPAIVEAKWGWHLRRHVYQVHKETHLDLIIPEEWSGKKSTSKGKPGPKKGEKRSCNKKAAKTPKKKPDLSIITPPAYPAQGYNTPVQPAGPVEHFLDYTNLDAALAAFVASGVFDDPVVEDEPTLPAVEPILDYSNHDAAFAAPAAVAGMDGLGVGCDNVDWDAFLSFD